MSIVKLVRNAAISMVALLVVFAGAGVFYVWYTGQNEDEIAVATTPVVNTARVEIKPSKPAPDAVVGLSVQSLSTPVAPGSNASIIVRTNPEAECDITVEYNKVPSKDSGLITKVADEFGIISWAWTVEESTPLGKWPVKVTCKNEKNSGVVQGDLEVAHPTDE